MYKNHFCLVVWWHQDSFVRAKKWVQELQRQGISLKCKLGFILIYLILHYIFLFFGLLPDFLDFKDYDEMGSTLTECNISVQNFPTLDHLRD